MDFITLISVLAGVVTIVGGIAGFLRYLHTRDRKVISPHFLKLAGQHQQALESCQKALRDNPQYDQQELGAQCAWASSGGP